MRRGLLLVAGASFLVAAVAVRPSSLRGHAESFTRPPEQLRAVAKMTSHLPRLTVAVADYRPPLIPRVVLGAAVSRPVVALTFDLDMTPAMAAQVTAGVTWFNGDALNYLRSQHVHATMFMTGMWAEIYPSVARQIAADPNFEIGNHSYYHPR